MALLERTSAANPRSYGFEDVVVHGRRRSLVVAGTEVHVRPRVFALLLALCEAQGAAVEREALLTRLWPDNPYPSDESLTQLVHRLRSALGATGRCVTTLRGVGFRLDARLNLIPDGPPEGPSKGAGDREVRGDPFPAGWSRAGSSRRSRRRWLPLGATASILLLAGLLTRDADRSQPLAPGFGMRRDDLQAARNETPELVRRAVAADGFGDRGRAIALLEAAHRADPKTPIPAALLALWSPHGEANRWAAEAQRRLQPGSPVYPQLFVRYVLAQEHEDDDAGEAAASALLEIRPDAWQLRLARARFHLARLRRPGGRSPSQQ